METTLQWAQGVKLLILVVFAYLYALGGMHDKWRRRFLAPFIYIAGLMGVAYWCNTFSWFYAISFPLMALALSRGYGASTTSEKIKRRALYGLGVGLACLPIAIVNQAWLLLGFHVALCVATLVILGVWNPTKSARAEETTIGLIIGILPIMGMI